MIRWLAALALLAAGCASAPKPPPAVAASKIEPPAASPSQAKPALAKPEPAPGPAAPVPPKTPPAAPATAPAKAPVPVAAAKPVAPKPAPAAAPATAKAPAASAPLDLKALEERLKQTQAIGLMTKLSLKNQVDDLVNEFRAYYAGRSKAASLNELRRPYELLLMKVLSLLQDRDPALARAVNASRDQIWSILSDREKFFSNLS